MPQGGAFEKDLTPRLFKDSGMAVKVGAFRFALQAAASGGRHKVVKPFLQSGADANLQGVLLQMALQAAPTGGHGGMSSSSSL